MKLDEAKERAIAKSEQDTQNYYHVTLSVPQLGIYQVVKWWTRESRYYAHKGQLLETHP